MPIIIYKCKHCLKSFKTRNEAINCEKKHVTIESTNILAYGYSIYPTQIEITFSDGKKSIYMPEDYIYYGCNGIKNKTEKGELKE